jgi:serine/threonine protein kinase
MTPENWQRIRRILEAAVELSPAERQAFLDEAAREDPVLRKEVDSLLALDQADSFLRDPEVPASYVLRLLPVPERIGRYRVERKLGEGGMGVVYAAHDDQLDRPLAIKMLVGAGRDEQRRKRLVREARAAAKVRHPNVCQLYEIGEESDEPYLAMELLDGTSLHDRLGGDAIGASEASRISLEVLSALSALHEQGIVHRDLKPTNIFLTPHGVKLLDFGLARTVSSFLGNEEATESQLTRAGAVVGTPQYMSPEQFRGEPVDERSDIFSAGVILYEMLDGSRPFQGSSPVTIYHAILYEEPKPLEHSGKPDLWNRVVRRALAKDRAERFKSAAEMADALTGAMGAVPASAEIPPSKAATRLMVLPFRVLRPDPDTDFLGISIPDAITVSLAGLESLVVRSSAAAARYADGTLDLKRIAKEAEVEVVLTGTLLRSGEYIRVSTQLLSAPDGTLLWSHTPQVTMRDIFQLQDEIVHRIVDSLALKLTARETRRLRTDVPASPTAFELYLRGSQLIVQGLRGGEDLSVARDLFIKCVEEDPQYAPAWARLGRCYGLIAKGVEGGAAFLEKAQSCFEKALELSPELPLAHNLYALVQPDLGRALDAVTRLLGRLSSGSSEPELFAGLLHACRYCGLLEASLAAHERARRLDPLISTSVNQTLFQLGDLRRAKEVMGKGTIILDAVIMVMEGDRAGAVRVMAERERSNLPSVTRAILMSLRALAEENRDESLAATRHALVRLLDPEVRYYLSRHLAYCGEAEEAVLQLREALDRGFSVYRMLTRDDPWLASIHSARGYDDLLAASRERYRAAFAAYVEAGGDKLLGPNAPP